MTHPSREEMRAITKYFGRIMAQVELFSQPYNPMIEIIFRFPTSISLSVVCTWLRPRDVAKNDSALCSRKWRKVWLDLFGAGDAVLYDPECDWLCGDVDAFVKWGIARKLRFNEVAVCGPKGLTQQLGEQFFLRCAGALTKLSCCGQELASIVLRSFVANLGSRVPNLRRLVVGHCTISRTEVAFFYACSATLKELYLRKCFLRSKLQFPSGVIFNAVKVLSIDNSLCLEASIALLNACPAMSELWLYGINYSCALLREVARQQPSLTVLLLADLLDLSEEVLVETFHELPDLQVVLLCGFGIAVTDTSVRALVQCCPRLHALRLTYCGDITHASLNTIAQYCATRLTHLAISRCIHVSMKGVTHLVQRCKALVDLTLGYIPNQLDGDGQWYTLDKVLLHVTQLQSLDLKRVLLDRAALDVLCCSFASLQCLCLFNPEDGSDRGCIDRLVAHLPALRRICTISHEANSIEGFRFTSANVAAWQRMRPGLVVTDVDRSPFWEKYVFPMFPLDDWTEESSVVSEASEKSDSGSYIAENGVDA